MPTFQDMKTVYEIRRANLRQLMTNWGGPTSLSARLGHSNGSYIAQLAGPRPSRDISEKVARGIEETLGLAPGWMDEANQSTISKAPALDAGLLADAMTAVATVASGVGKKLAPEAMAEVVGLVYEHAQSQGGAQDEQFIKRLLRLAK